MRADLNRLSAPVDAGVPAELLAPLDTEDDLGVPLSVRVDDVPRLKRQDVGEADAGFRENPGEL